jgi:hypothetical protein
LVVFAFKYAYFAGKQQGSEVGYPFHAIVFYKRAAEKVCEMYRRVGTFAVRRCLEEKYPVVVVLLCSYDIFGKHKRAGALAPENEQARGAQFAEHCFGVPDVGYQRDYQDGTQEHCKEVYKGKDKHVQRVFVHAVAYLDKVGMRHKHLPRRQRRAEEKRKDIALGAFVPITYHIKDYARQEDAGGDKFYFVADEMIEFGFVNLVQDYDGHYDSEC